MDLRIFLTSAKCPNLVKLLVLLLVCHFDCVLTDAEERSSDDVVMELETNEEELETNEEELDNVFHICVPLPHSASATTRQYGTDNLSPHENKGCLSA